MSRIVPPGKLPAELLARLLASLPGDPRVIIGPRPGEDAAVIEFGDRYLVAKSDPITFATDQIGWYAVQINANDIATAGAEPRFMLATALLPVGWASPERVEDIFNQLASACDELNVTLIGGHTEVTDAVSRPVLIGCMMGELVEGEPVSTGGAGPGDVVLLTKGIPIEAISILAREMRRELEPRFGAEFLDRCANFLYEPGISVVREAHLAYLTGGVTSMHDPTEGGLATALWELADACGHTVIIEGEMPVLEEGRLLCRALGLDPMAAIASGALLLTADPEHERSLKDAIGGAGIPIYHIGHIAAGPPVVLTSDGETVRRPERDELARLFERDDGDLVS